MFHHTTVTSKSKHDHAICWDRQEPSVEWGVERELTTIELFQPDSSWEDIADLYHDVYQLWRLQGKILCDKEIGGTYASSINGLPHCQGRNQDGVQPGSLGSNPKLNSMPGTAPLMIGSWMLSKTLVRILFSHSHQCSGSCRCLGSCQGRRSQTVDHWIKVPQVMSHHEDPTTRWSQSPSPSWSRWQVTFTHLSHRSNLKRDTSVKEPHLVSWGDERRPGDSSNWSRPKEEDLEC